MINNKPDTSDMENLLNEHYEETFKTRKTMTTEKTKEINKMKTIIVYYQKNFNPFAKYTNNFSKTHTKVFEGVVKDNENQEHVFKAFNDNYLNPLSRYNTTNKVCLLDSEEAVTGEEFQKAMKENKVSCEHTSMSVGDIVSVNGTNYLCKNSGWKQLSKKVA